MHPPKADRPAGGADPRQDHGDGLHFEMRIHFKKNVVS
jgi:hypothetical protein